jgi:hypothetical protein
MAKRLTVNHRGRIAEKVMEWGNLAFVGLVIGQLVPGTGGFRLSMVLAGLVSMAGAYLLAIFLMKGGG